MPAQRIVCAVVMAALAASPAIATVIEEEPPVKDAGSGEHETATDDSPVLVGNMTLDKLRTAKPSEAYELLSENLGALGAGDVTGKDDAELAAKYERAAALIQQGDPAAAEPLLEEILAAAPGHARASTLLGLAKYLQGDLDAAQQILVGRAGTGTDPVADKLLAAIELRSNHPEQALELLEGNDGLQPTDPDVLTMLGVAKLAQGDVDAGVQSLKDALALAPERHALRIRLAEFLVRAGRFDEAAKELDAIPAESGYAKRADELKIGIFARQGRIDDARALADAWIERAPEDSRALTVAAGLALMQNDRERGRSLLERAVASDDSNVIAHTYLANLALASRDFDTAEKHYQHALVQVPENVTALKGLVTVHEAQGDRDGAVALLEQRIRETPDALAPRLVLAEYYLRNGRDSDAMPLAEAALKANPKAPYAQQVMNSLLYRKALGEARGQDWAAARSDLQRMLEINDNNPLALATLANVEAASGHAQQGLEIADQLEKRYPDAQFAEEVRGDIASRQGDTNAAAKHYAAAFSKARSPALATKMAAAHQRAGRAKEAQALLADWAHDAPKNVAAGLLYAESLMGTGGQANAIKEYERILELAPENAVALNNLAWLYFEAGDERAEATARHAYEQASDSADVLDTLGWILVGKGKLDEGIGLLERALELSPKNAPIMEHLRAALAKRGDDERAKQIAAELRALSG